MGEATAAEVEQVLDAKQELRKISAATKKQNWYAITEAETTCPSEGERKTATFEASSSDEAISSDVSDIAQADVAQALPLCVPSLSAPQMEVSSITAAGAKTTGREEGYISE